MARRPTIELPASATLTPNQMRVGVAKLQRRIAELQAFDVTTYVDDGANPELSALTADIKSTLSDVFGPNTVEYQRFSPAAFFDTGPLIMSPFGRGGGIAPRERQKHLSDSVSESVATLQSALKLLNERLEDVPPPLASESNPPAVRSRRIFVVHGHDEAAKLSIARFLEQLKFEAIILHEQPNQGRTIIEKIEGYSDVGFAVVLLTPDDECIAPIGNRRRARQNVILELGYFIALLGRGCVAALKKGEVELPSDVMGVVYTDFDERGAWKMDLARELNAAGYNIAAIPF